MIECISIQLNPLCPEALRFLKSRTLVSLECFVILRRLSVIMIECISIQLNPLCPEALRFSKRRTLVSYVCVGTFSKDCERYYACNPAQAEALCFKVGRWSLMNVCVLSNLTYEKYVRKLHNSETRTVYLFVNVPVFHQFVNVPSLLFRKRPKLK
jgi:hypothetical protein